MKHGAVKEKGYVSRYKHTPHTASTGRESPRGAICVNSTFWFLSLKQNSKHREMMIRVALLRSGNSMFKGLIKATRDSRELIESLSDFLTSLAYPVLF